MGSLGFGYFQQGYNFDEFPFALTKKSYGRGQLAATVEDVRHKKESASGGDFLKIKERTAAGRLDHSQTTTGKIGKGGSKSQGG